MNTVLETLCSDHANFAKLLNVIEHQADLAASQQALDIDILAKAVEYLEGYPAHYHHALEDALAARLKAAAPGVNPKIDEIVRQHAQIRGRLAQLKEQLPRLSRPGDIVRADFAEDAYAYVDAEWSHMELERTALFTPALEAFADDDWLYLTTCIPQFQDPLFGGDIPAPLERLHQALLECDTRERTVKLLRKQIA